MARRSHIVSVLSSIVFLVAVFAKTTVFAAVPNTTFNRFSVSELNIKFNDAGGPSTPRVQTDTIISGDTVTLTINPQDGVQLDTEAMNGKSQTPAVNFTLTINKSGAGNWRLGDGSLLLDPLTGLPIVPPTYMANILNSGTTGTNTFDVNAGILDLMRGTTLQMTGGAAGSRLRVSTGASLNARGANVITLNGPTMQLANNSTLGFDLTHSDSGYTSGTPVLTVDGSGNVSNLNAGDQVNINLLGFAEIDGSAANQVVSLFRYNYGAVLPQGLPITNPAPVDVGDWQMDGSPGVNYVRDRPDSNVDFLVRGEQWEDVVSASNGRLRGTLEQRWGANDEATTRPAAAARTQTTLVITNFHSNIGTVTWTGNPATGVTGRTWNATASNWTGTGSTFLHGDSVVFGSAAPTSLRDIVVQAGGVQIGSTLDGGLPLGFRPGEFGMLVNDGSYSFTNDINPTTGNLGTIGIDGQGIVIVAGPFTTLDFNSANSYWGGTRIENGILTARNAFALGTGDVDIHTPGVLVFDVLNPADAWQVSNDISGELGSTVVKRGDGSLSLNGAAKSQDTVVYEGTLFNNIGSGVLTVYGGATYNATTSPNEVRRITGLHDWPIRDPAELRIPEPTGISGDVVMGTRRLTIDVEDFNDTYTFSGTISGSVGNGATLNKAGPGTQILTGNSPNLYGGTNIGEGTLVIQRRGLVDPDLIEAVGPALFPTITTPRPITLTNGVNIERNGVLQLDIIGSDSEIVSTFHNEIHGSGQVIKKTYPKTDPSPPFPPEDPEEPAIPATLLLTSQYSSYTGTTEVHDGVLRLGHINATGETFEVQLAADTALQFETGPLPANHLVGNHTYDRIITGIGDVEVLSGTDVYVIGRNNRGTNNDRSGVTSSYTGETIVHLNATLRLLDAKATGETSKVELVDRTSNLYLEFDDDEVYDRWITGSGNLTKTRVGTTTLALASNMAPPNDYTGLTTVDNGILQLMYANATGTDDPVGVQNVIVNGDGILELAFDGNYNKGIRGTGAIAKSGENTVTTLAGFSSYSGGTYIWGGTLSFTDTASTVGNLGSGGVFFQNGGGTLRNTRENLSFDQRIEIEGGSTATFETEADMVLVSPGSISHVGDQSLQSHLTKTGAANLTIETVAAWSGRTVVEEGWLIGNIPEDTELTVMAPGGYQTGDANRRVSLLEGDGTVVTFVGRDFTVNIAEVDDTNNFGGTITGDGNLVKIGKGLFILSGEGNDYAGRTAVMLGTLRGNIADRTALFVGGDATYDSGGRSRTIQSLEGSGVVDMRNSLLGIDMSRLAPTTVATFNGRIRNGSRLVKSGEATQVLAGQLYDFSEDVIINGGTLCIGSTFPSATDFRVGGNMEVKKDTTFAINPFAQVTVGKTLTIDGTFDVTVGTNLVNANEVKLGDESAINITGITSASETRTIIQSNNDIDGRFQYEMVAGDPSTNVDYLIFGVSYDDPKAIKVGQTLRWYSGKDAHGTFTLANPNGSYNVGVSLHNITDESKRPNWDGETLTKKGLGTLVLSASNTYTGETQVDEGTLKLAHSEATLGSSRIVLGLGALELDFDGSMATRIIETGSAVYKTGDSTSVLTGRSTYTAPTYVQQGSLYVDGSLTSHVWVDAGAGFGGNGRVNETVTFREGSFFDWRFGKNEEESDMLTATRVDIGKNVWVRPNTNIPTLGSLTNFYGWKILHYSDSRSGSDFAGVENSANPYYDFELDYSLAGFVRINGFLRDEPRALSDIVTTTLLTPQTRMYRSVYQQIAREWASDCPEHPTMGRYVGGQSPHAYRTAWVSFVGRGDQYASNYFHDKYQFQSYGLQAGFSLISNCRTSLGFMYGREESKLGNFSDTVRGEDNYMGIYYGRSFDSEIDFRSYIGWGWQVNQLERNSNGSRYHARYGGNTFNIDAEFGRRFLTERQWMLRPFLGFDLAVSWIGNATETSAANPTSNEYRAYQRASHTEFLTRAGVEVGKGWRMIDFHTGIQLAWNWGDTDPSARVYYPVTGGSVVSRAADAGRFDLIMNVGVNWYITPQRNTMFFLNYIGDIYLDRQGNTGNNTGHLGFGWKF